MKKFAVMGSPIAHSLSPQIHQYFAAQCAISLSYQTIEVKAGCLKDALVRFKNEGGNGVNITVPLKLEAFKLCEKHLPEAKIAQAVNTIGWEEETYWGDNTDGQGLISDLKENLKLELNNKKILILGAGGATLGIVGPLLKFSQDITVVNRDFIKLQAILKHYPIVTTYAYDSVPLLPYDIIINATSASLQNALPPLNPLFVNKTVVIDLAYHLGRPTIFMEWAKINHALAVFDGIGMLIEQAARAFYRWHGILPPTVALIQQFRKIKLEKIY